MSIITSGCGTAIEYLSIFAEKYSCKEVNKKDFAIKDAPVCNMLNIINMINDSDIITEDSVLVSFDIANMFPSIDNFSDLEAVSDILENMETDFSLLNLF